MKTTSLSRAMVIMCNCKVPNCVTNGHFGQDHCSVQVRARNRDCRSCQRQVMFTKNGPNPFFTFSLDAWLGKVFIGIAFEGHSARDFLNLKKATLSMASSSGMATTSNQGPEAIVEAIVCSHSQGQDSKPMARSGDLLVHHLWIQVNNRPLPKLAVQCCSSWHAHPQWLWIYCAKDLPEAIFKDAPSTMVLKDLSDIMKPGEVASLLDCDVPVQFIKDMLSFRILYCHGGLFVDLDIWCLSGTMDLSPDHVHLALEPHHVGKDSSMPRARKTQRYTLALLAMPILCPIARLMFDALRTKWRTFAMSNWAKAMKGQDITTEWRSSPLWMYNTNLFTQTMHKFEDVARIVHPPVKFVPLPHKMTLAIVLAMQAGPRTSSCVLLQPQDLSKPYKVPSLLDLQDHCWTVNMWSRQWDEPVCDHVVRLLTGIAEARAIPADPLPAPAWSKEALGVRNAIEERKEWLCDTIGHGQAFHLMGFAMNILQTGWFLDMLGNRIINNGPATSGGVPGAATGIGPWRGPAIAPKVWAAVLLWAGLDISFTEEPQPQVDNPWGNHGTSISPAAGTLLRNTLRKVHAQPENGQLDLGPGHCTFPRAGLTGGMQSFTRSVRRKTVLEANDVMPWFIVTYKFRA